MKGNHDREINEILDAALSSYSAEAPRAGLEQRVLNQVKHDVRRPRTSWLRPVLIVLASACLLVAIVSLTVLRKPVAHPSVAVAGTKRFQALPSIAATVPLKISEPSKPVQKRKRPGTGRLAEKQRPLPKLKEFPAPIPPTNEERQLLALARYPVKYLPASIVKATGEDDQPIEIEPLKIEPLKIKPL